MEGTVRTTITLNMRALNEEAAKRLLRAIDDLKNGQSQFVVKKRNLDDGEVMRVSSTLQVAPARFLTPESALDMIRIMRERWQRR